MDVPRGKAVTGQIPLADSTIDTRLLALSDRYRIEREVGSGGMATVYLAHDLQHDRDVAIKVVHPDLGAALGAERFLAEIKTTNKEFNSIPRSYLRQIWWQQYVLGAERTLFVWEQHSRFVPLHDEPQCQWVDRDEAEITKLVALAGDLIELLRRATSTAAAPGSIVSIPAVSPR